MRTIAIETAQKVTIEYALAEVRDRILAFILDQIIAGFALFLVSLVYIWLFADSVDDEELMILFYILFVLPIYVCYTLAFEVFNNGKTLGKMALKLQVIRLSGGAPSVTDYIVRWVFRFVDVYSSSGAVAAIMASSTDKGQRIGGLMSGTTVISTRPPSNYRLEDIARINTSEGYEPTFPEAVNLKEEDVVIIKRVLERCKTEKGDASEEALNATVKVIQERLHIKGSKLSSIEFLKTILKDFVVLSR